MPAERSKDSATPATDSYIPVPLYRHEGGGGLRLCLLVRNRPDAVGGHLITLRDTADARLLLGCLIDAAGKVHQWIEIWVQTVDGIAESPAAWRDLITNAALDARWQHQMQAFVQADPKMLIRTGWESQPAPPLWIDVKKFESVEARDPESGEVWRLCRDDALLLDAGLPAYSSTLHRYLCLKVPGAEPVFSPITAGAPLGDRTRAAADIQELSEKSGWVPVNPGGGLMLLRRHYPVGLEEYLNLLSGAPTEPRLHGRSPVRIDEPLLNWMATHGAGGDALDASNQGWLFLGPHGQWGRVLESFHLKLMMLADAVDAVRSTVRRTQRPILNLEPSSFQVRAGSESLGGRGVPFLWTTRTILADAGDALELPIQSSDARYYLPGRPVRASMYQPESLGHFTTGRCSVRIRKILSEAGDALLVEGTLVTDERVRAESADLVHLQFPLGGGRTSLYVHLQTERALTAGEYRFRSLAQRFSGPTRNQLKSAEGVPLSQVEFEVIPLLSTPVDLYALGVLAVRTLLVNPQTSLAKALDEVLSLGRQVAADQGLGSSLETRIRGIFELDPRWTVSLGPQRLWWEPIEPGRALDMIPADIWWKVLAMIVRLFPGIGPDSYCRSFGDARQGSIHTVFDGATNELDNLLVGTRSLIVIDWHYNREVHSVLRGFSTGISNVVDGNGTPPRAAVAAPRAAAAPVAGRGPMPVRRAPGG